MRESYRDKQNRKARISKENKAKEERRKEERRKEQRRKEERRKIDRRSGVDRRSRDRSSGSDRRQSADRRQNSDRRQGTERRVRDRRVSDSADIDELEELRERPEMEEKEYEDLVVGRNPVLELLKSNRDINKLFVESGEKHGSIREIIAKAKEQKVIVVEKDRQELDEMAENNQGVIAVVPPFNYCEVEDILELAKERNEDPFIVILDGIEDPHNLGAIIRTAETAGVHGIIIPKRRTAQVNSTVVKVSTGATSYMKIARVNNLNETIRKLKEENIWIIGTDGDANVYYDEQDLKGPIAIVVGSEGFGMSELVKKNSDILIKIPMKGKITSLNASVSAGIVMYEVLRQRK